MGVTPLRSLCNYWRASAGFAFPFPYSPSFPASATSSLGLTLQCLSYGREAGSISQQHQARVWLINLHPFPKGSSRFYWQVAALQVINEVLLARGQAVPEWLCKSGYLEVNRTARQRRGWVTSDRPEPLPVDLLVWPRRGWSCGIATSVLWEQEGLSSTKSWSCTSRWKHGAASFQGRLALQQAKRQPRCRTGWDTGKKTNP